MGHLAVEEHPVPGHEHLVEQHGAVGDALLAADREVPRVLGAGRRRDADDLESRGVDRHRARDCPVGVLLREGARRHDAQLVHDGRSEDVALGALQDDAVLGAAHHSQLATVLDGCGDAEVVVSTTPEEPLEPIAVGGVGLGQARGHAAQRHAARGARCRDIRFDQEVHLLVELSRGGRQIEDGVAGPRLSGARLLVGARHPVDRHPHERVGDRVLDALALEVRGTTVADRLPVVLCCEHPHTLLRSTCPCAVQHANGRIRGELT